MGPEDPVAGNQQRNGIGATGAPDCAHRLGASDRCRHFAITSRLAEGDVRERAPDGPLECRALRKVQRGQDRGRASAQNRLYRRGGLTLPGANLRRQTARGRRRGHGRTRKAQTRQTDPRVAREKVTSVRDDGKAVVGRHGAQGFARSAVMEVPPQCPEQNDEQDGGKEDEAVTGDPPLLAQGT